MAAPPHYPPLVEPLRPGPTLVPLTLSNPLTNLLSVSCHDASRPHSADSDLGRAAPTSALIAPRPSEFLEQPGLLPEGSNAICFIVGSARAAAGGRLEF